MDEYIIKTDYFRDSWTWVKRTGEFLIAAGFLYWLSEQETEKWTTYSWVAYLVFALLTIFIFTRPKDELALDTQNLYFIKKSLIPLFTKTNKYKISDIKSIGCGGVFNSNTEIFGLLGSGTNRNRLEIVFKDNSSKSHDTTIYKDELIRVVSKVNELRKQNSA